MLHNGQQPDGKLSDLSSPQEKGKILCRCCLVLLPQLDYHDRYYSLPAKDFWLNSLRKGRQRGSRSGRRIIETKQRKMGASASSLNHSQSNWVQQKQHGVQSSHLFSSNVTKCDEASAPPPLPRERTNCSRMCAKTTISLR